MALGKGIPVINGFDLNSKLPLDSRTVADTKENMNALVTNGSVGDGQLCYCKADKKLYVLKEGAWSEVGGGGIGVIFEITPEQAQNINSGFDITDKQYQFIITNKSVNCLIKIQNTNVEFPVAFTSTTQRDKITAFFSFGIYAALAFSSDDINPETNKHRLKFETNILKFYSGMSITGNEQRFDINGIPYSTFFDTIKGTNILHEHNNDTKDWQFTEDKTISLFGKHNILVPNDSADTSILPCTASDNGKVLSVVNGQAQWSNAGGGGNELYFDLSPYTETFQLDTEGLEKFTNAITKGKIIGVALISNGLFFDYKGIYKPSSSNYSYYFSNNNEGILISQEGAISPHLPIYMPFLPEDASTKNYTLNSVNGALTWNTIGDGLTIENGVLKATGGGGGKSVSPTLNLLDLETMEARTTITEEEKTNLENGLYNQIIFPGSLSDSDEIKPFMPTKLIGDKSFDTHAFAQFNCSIDGDVVIDGLSIYVYSLGAKDTSGNYPITIKKQMDIPIGGSGGSGGGSNVTVTFED